MNSVRSNNQSLKYQRFTPSGWKDIGTRKFQFVAKAQFPSAVLELSEFLNACIMYIVNPKVSRLKYNVQNIYQEEKMV